KRPVVHQSLLRSGTQATFHASRWHSVRLRCVATCTSRSGNIVPPIESAQLPESFPVKTSRLAAATLATATLFLGILPSHAEDSQYYGLRRSRDLTAFGFLRLDMRPAYAVSIEPGTWAIETELGYQNTWALSANVEHYLESVESTGRRDLSER